MQCHTAGAGRALGPELGQLNGDHVYPSTNRVANQLKTLEHVGLFAAPLGQPIDRIVTYPKPHGDAPLETRARSYLHANCSHCHSPGGGAGRTTMDLRFATSLPDSKTCDAAPVLGDLGIGGAKLVAPGHPESSVISKRMHALDAKRMPPLASGRVDDNGVQLIDAWIRGVTCP
jgi:hypothetical protein